MHKKWTLTFRRANPPRRRRRSRHPRTGSCASRRSSPAGGERERQAEQADGIRIFRQVAIDRPQADERREAVEIRDEVDEDREVHHDGLIHFDYGDCYIRTLRR